MPYVKFSRDKRGYEQVALVHPGRDSRPRTLYVFRTPPGVRVGREPFDIEARRLLETRYPDISFDWNNISAAQAPPPEEPWRERRRLKRAAKESALEKEFALEDEADAAADESPQQSGREQQPDGIAARPGRRRRRGRRRSQRASVDQAPAVPTDEQSTAEPDHASES